MNTIPASVPKPDQGELLAGQGLDSAAVAKLFQANVWAQAYVGTGTPRISQMFPRRGGSGTTGLVVYTSALTQNLCTWRIPDTRGTTSVSCYAYGSSVGGNGKVKFTSSFGAGDTGLQNLPAAAGLIGPFALTIDASGGSEVVRLAAAALAGGDITLDAVLVVVDPLGSPIGPGADSLGVIAYDEDEYADYESLAADGGGQSVINLTAVRGIPHVYAQWSGVDNIADATAIKMVSLEHVIPMLVWADTDRESWLMTVYVLTRNTGGGDTTVVVNIGMGSRPDRFETSLTLTSTSGEGSVWHTGTIQLPNLRKYIRGAGPGLESVTMSLWPIPTSANGVEDYIDKYNGSEDELSTAEILSVAVWGR